MTALTTLKMRLSRYGVRRNPFYGIVVTHTSAPRDARHLDRIGTYNPIPDAQGIKHIELDLERCKYWLGNGVEVSEKVGWLLAKVGGVGCAVLGCASLEPPVSELACIPPHPLTPSSSPSPPPPLLLE